MCRKVYVMAIRILGIILGVSPLVLLYGIFSLVTPNQEPQYGPKTAITDTLNTTPMQPHREALKELAEPPESLKQWEREFRAYNPPGTVDMQIWCIAKSVFYEARSEPERGKILVAQVIMNRVESKRFPSTPCEVVYQPSRDPKRPKACQYSFTCAPQKTRIEDEPKAWDDAYRIAVKVYYKLDQSFWSRADHYHRDDVSPGWAEAMEYRGRVGRHLFYVAGGI